MSKMTTKKTIFDLKGNELQRAFNSLGIETDGEDWDESSSEEFKLRKVFTTEIQEEVKKMDDYSGIHYDDEQGVPLINNDPEYQTEFGVDYSIASPLSPYVLGHDAHKLLCDICKSHSFKKEDAWLCDVFTAFVDFKNNKVSVYYKEKEGERK